MGPFGNRLIVEVDGGEFEGEGFKGKIRSAAGADWLTLTEKFGHLDVRVTFETSDGALIFVEYSGKLELTDPDGVTIRGNSVRLIEFAKRTMVIYFEGYLLSNEDINLITQMITSL